MENNNNFENLKFDFQEIIDLIGIKKIKIAQEKLIIAKDSIDEMIDYAKYDADLIAIRKYQILWKKLQMQLENLN